MPLLAWGRKVPSDFAEKVCAIAAEIGIDPSWLMAIMYFETGGTFDPAKRNPSSDATGLIGFMPKTAAGMGTSVAALAKKTAVAQLDDVRDYFKPFAGRLKTLSDAYMAVLWPRAVGRFDSEVIFGANDKAYLLNRGLDMDRDGGVTKGEAAAFVQRRLEEGLLPLNSLMVPAAGERQGPAAPIEERVVSPQPLPPRPVRQEIKMDPFSILGIFGSTLVNLIPQLTKLFANPEDKKQQRNIEAIQLVLDTFTQSALKNPNASGNDPAAVGQAIMAVRADPALKEEVTKTVLTTPGIMEILEVGGGAAKAREYDLQQQQSQQPFWKASAVFWVSVILLPLVYWLVGSLIAGGTLDRLIEAKVDVPNWLRLILSMFGTAWNGESRSGGFNLVIGLVLGGICGVYFGVSVTQGRNSSGSSSAMNERQP